LDWRGLGVVVGGGGQFDVDCRKFVRGSDASVRGGWDVTRVCCSWTRNVSSNDLGEIAFTQTFEDLQTLYGVV